MFRTSGSSRQAPECQPTNLDRPSGHRQPFSNLQPCPQGFASCSVTIDKNTVLGRGVFNVVYAGELCDGTKVAVKVIRRAHDDILKEVEMRCVNRTPHPNVVCILGLVKLDDGTVWVVMERLREPLTKAQVTEPSDRMQYTLDIIAGMEHMHSRGSVVPFDLKPTNILLTHDGRGVKIIDFSVPKIASTLARDSIVSMISTLPFMAPEQFFNGQFSSACDVYSFAVVLAELWTGTVAWKDLEASELLGCLVREHRPFTGSELTKKRVPASIIALIFVCWEQTPERRPTFAQIGELQKIKDFHLASQEAWPLFLRTQAAEGLGVPIPGSASAFVGETFANVARRSKHSHGEQERRPFLHPIRSAAQR
jgi:serine/threonine protein kinase